jgi:hypothetical protein
MGLQGGDAMNQVPLNSSVPLDYPKLTYPTCGATRVSITDENGDSHQGAWKFPTHASKEDQGIIDGVN